MNRVALKIITVSDLTWQNGLEYALDGINKARNTGVKLEYEIIGQGPMLEALGFSIHELDLDEFCEIKKFQLGKINSDVFLLPAVSQVSLNFKRLIIPKRMKWVVTQYCLGIKNYTKAENIIQVHRWDSDEIAKVLISIFDNGIL